MSVEHYGLFNQGATCYLNSVLQVLYMTKDFAEEVDRHTRENPDTDRIDRHLNTLFNHLNGAPAHTRDVTNSLGIDRVNEPRDAAECFEKILGLTSHTASEIFRGQLTHKTICSECCEVTDINGAFWHIPLALVDSYSPTYSVENGIVEYFRTSDFSGENQMYCNQCDAKSDATIECVMKHHPEVLMLLLKRFEFDYNYMTYVKDNQSVDVRSTLQIPQNQNYELYAFVEHVGDLRNGHYTATIKADKGWHKFDDSSVRLVHPQPFQVDDIMKSRNAYLLFYRKQKVCREMSTPPDFPPTLRYVTDECQHTAEMGERQEAEVAADAFDDPTVTVSNYSNDETGTEDVVSDKLRHLDKQDEMSDAWGSIMSVKTDKDKKTADAEQSENEGKVFTKSVDEQTEHENRVEVSNIRQNMNGELGGARWGQDYNRESVGGVDKVDKEEYHWFNKDRVEGRRESKPSETLCTTEEKIRSANIDRSIEKDHSEGSASPDFPPTHRYVTEEGQHTAEMGERQEAEVAAEVGDDPTVTVSNYSNDETGTEDVVSDKLRHFDKQDEMSDARRSIMSVKTDKDKKTADAEQSKNEGRFLIKYIDEQIEYKDSVEVSKVRQNMNKDLGGARWGQDYDREPVGGVGKEEYHWFNKDKMEGRRESKPSETLCTTEEKIRPANIERSKSLEEHKRKLDLKLDPTLSDSLCNLNLSHLLPAPLPKRQKKKDFGAAQKQRRNKKSNVIRQFIQ